MFLKDGKTFQLPTAGYGIGADGTIYRDGCPADVDGINYPAGTGPLFSPEGRAEFGITDLPVVARPDERFFTITDNGDGTFTAEPKELDQLRDTVRQVVRQMRQMALDTFPKSPGVSEIYAENLKAAQADAAGAGATTIMRDDTTAETYLGAMAAGMGISAAQFAAYVLAENTAAAIKAREIEAEYVRLAYTFIPACTFEQVQTVADGYRDFCQARTGG